jgi:hypothetical protein
MTMAFWGSQFQYRTTGDPVADGKRAVAVAAVTLLVTVVLVVAVAIWFW